MIKAGAFDSKFNEDSLIEIDDEVARGPGGLMNDIENEEIKEAFDEGSDQEDHSRIEGEINDGFDH